jgi:hypothetical protein
MRVRTLLVLAGAVGVWTASGLAVSHAVHTQRTVTSRPQLCQQYDAFTDSLVPARPPGALRLNASRLADLAQRYPWHPLPDSLPAHDAATAIRQVMALPYSTVQDLWAASRPVAVECGVDYRTGSPTMYQGPAALTR